MVDGKPLAILIFTTLLHCAASHTVPAAFCRFPHTAALSSARTRSEPPTMLMECVLHASKREIISSGFRVWWKEPPLSSKVPYQLYFRSPTQFYGCSYSPCCLPSYRSFIKHSHAQRSAYIDHTALAAAWQGALCMRRKGIQRDTIIWGSRERWNESSWLPCLTLRLLIQPFPEYSLLLAFTPRLRNCPNATVHSQ